MLKKIMKLVDADTSIKDKVSSYFNKPMILDVKGNSVIMKNTWFSADYNICTIHDVIGTRITDDYYIVLTPSHTLIFEDCGQSVDVNLLNHYRYLINKKYDACIGLTVYECQISDSTMVVVAEDRGRGQYAAQVVRNNKVVAECNTTSITNLMLIFNMTETNINNDAINAVCNAINNSTSEVTM